MKKFYTKIIELMQLDIFYSNEDKDLKSINEIRAFRIRKQKIENDKKARKYIYEINQRYKKINDYKNLFKRAS